MSEDRPFGNQSSLVPKEWKDEKFQSWVKGKGYSVNTRQDYRAAYKSYKMDRAQRKWRERRGD